MLPPYVVKNVIGLPKSILSKFKRHLLKCLCKHKLIICVFYKGFIDLSIKNR